MQAPSPDSLQDPSYLIDPFETLFYSLDDFTHESLSLHDIAEAYNTIHIRLRAYADHLASAQSYPALQILKDDATRVTAVLTRDISRALTLPQGLSRLLGTPIDQSRSGPRTEREDVQYAKDSAAVSHHSLQVLAQFLHSETIFSLLPEHDLTVLLEAVIAILRTPVLPSFNASKTCVLSICALKAQRLPRNVVRNRANELTAALQRILDRTSTITTTDLIVDALETVDSLLANHHDVLLQPFCNLLSPILIHLTAASSRLRHQAACSLAAYCSLLVQTSAEPLHSLQERVSPSVQSFLRVQTSLGERDGLDRLPSLLRSALHASDPYEPGCGAIWALTVVAILTLLYGHSIFYHPHAIRLCLETTGWALKHPHPIRDLHPQVWRCFIWAFGCLRDRLSEDMHDNARQDLEDTVEKVLRVIKQELRHGLGIAFVQTLLGPAPPDLGSQFGQHPDSWGVSRAICVVHDMLQHDAQDIQEAGTEVFVRLLMGASEQLSVGASETGDLLSQALIDGTVLFAKGEKQLWGILKSIQDDGIKHLRQLSPMEIIHSWDALVACWTVIAIRHRESHTQPTLDETLILIWRILLSSRLQFISEQENASSHSKVTSTITQFLPSPMHQGTSVSNTSAVRQWQSLHIMKQLWDVMTEDIPDAASMRAAALAILAPVLKLTFDLTHDSVKGSWSVLCASLLMAASPDVLKGLSVDSDEQGAVDLRRQLWTALASSWDTRRDQQGCADTISFLVMPFGHWLLSSFEFELWEAVLERATMGQSAPLDQALSVVEGVAQRLMHHDTRLPVNYRVKFAIALVRTVTLEDTCSFPSNTFSFMNSTLADLYSSTEETSSSLELLSILHNQTLLAPNSLLIPLLSSLEDSLCLWFSDAEAVTTDEEYNSTIVPFYKAILIRLKETVPSLATLYAATPLLVSVFTHVPQPALGPLAFKEFFDDIFLHRGLPAHAYPDDLLFHARCCVESFGGELLPGMAESGSQSQFDDHVKAEVGFKCLSNDSSLGTNARVTEAFDEHHPRAPEAEPPEFVQGSSSRKTPQESDRSKPGADSSLLPYVGHAVTPSMQSAISRSIAGGSYAAPVDRSSPGVSRQDRSTSSRHAKQLATAIQSSRVPASSTSSSKRRSSTAGAQSSKKRKLDKAEDSTASHPRTQSATPNRVSSPKVDPARRAAPRGLRPARKMVFDCVEVEPYANVLRRYAAARKKAAKGKGKRKDERDGRPASPLEDYDDWETTLGTPQTIKLRDELLQDQEIVPETPDANYISPDHRIVPCLHVQGSPSRRLETASAPPSLPTPTSSPLRHYGAGSMNDPRPVLSLHSPVFGAPPLRRADTTSTHLDILRQAHDILTSGGLSQMQMPDLITANQIVEEMGVAVNGKLRKRLADGRVRDV